jgi:rubrerythrin
MSILDSLLRFVDPISFRKKQEELQRKRKVQPPGSDDEVDLPAQDEWPARAATPLICRVCGYSGGPEHRFCPRCLAETMERRR